MLQRLDPAALKAQLPHTWRAFFARHGKFTPIQVQAIPPILAGRNTLVVAATAAGKTEAAIAPVLERHVLAGEPLRASLPLRVLYVCPTRALVRDLYERLAQPLESLGVTLMRKSGDTGPVPIQSPPTVLITTPESVDSLLTRAPRLLTMLRAIVLDEIHLFDNGVRGDHLRCLLRRIESIRRYHAAEQGIAFVALQRVALSATIPDAVGVAERYLQDTAGGGGYEIVEIAERRRLVAEIRPIIGSADLVAAITQQLRGRTALRKALAFCNTRHEVEQIAAILREQLPTETSVFVHYSNLNPSLRREVEDGFAAAPVAVCVCTSTLELGIDIGSIDHVVLVGPPASLTSFLQRIGRGGRRTGVTRVLCLARSPLEEVRFQALLDLAQSPMPYRPNSAALPSAYHFRPSVLVQQTFSILKQSPTGGLRLADLCRVAPPAVSEETARRVLNHLVLLGYLKTGRPGEWRVGAALDELVDAHEIYSNIGADPLAVVVVDAYSGRVLALTDRVRWEGDTLLLGGRRMEVVWRDRYKMGVRPRADAPEETGFGLGASSMAVSLEVSRAVATHLGLADGQLCLLQDEQGVWLFHFWGDLYGELLRAILQATLDTAEEPMIITRRNEHCLRLPWGITQLPAWDDALARQQLIACLPRLEAWVEVGRFQSLLPRDMADETVMEQSDLPRLARLYQAATVLTPPDGLRARLQALLK